MSNKLANALLGVFLTGSFGVVGAHEANMVNWTVVEAAQSGLALAGQTYGGDARLKIELAGFDHDDHRLLVLLDQCAEEVVPTDRPIRNLEQVLSEGADPEYVQDWQPSAPRWKYCTEAGSDVAVLEPGSSSQVLLNVDFLKIGDERMNPRLQGRVYIIDDKQTTTRTTAADLADLYRDKSPAAYLNIDLYYRLTGESWQMGNFDEVYGVMKRGESALTSNYLEMASNMPVNLAGYRLSRAMPDLTTDEDGDLLGATLKDVFDSGVSYLHENSSCIDCNAPQIGDTNPGDIPFGSSYTIKGRLSSAWGTDLSMHPAFGFLVDAYGNTPNGWKRLGGTPVNSDGSWYLTIDSKVGYLGGDLEIKYRAANRYIQPVTSSGNVYSWKDPKYYVTTQTLNVGHRLIDTIALYGWGVPELIDAATQTWTRLVAAGINPLHAYSHTVVYPNVSYDCGKGDGVPWSCASTNGTIWLLSNHGIDASVVTHELGHQLNYKYWNNKLPANSGGSHNYESCYSQRKGMTLLEGFADFLIAWVGYPDRNVAAGNFNVGRWIVPYEAEDTAANPNCANGEENEVWVARTFWDLHDKHSDDADTIWFNHPGAVISLYLSNGVSVDGEARSMLDYVEVYKKAAGTQYEGYVSDIFKQNRM